MTCALHSLFSLFSHFSLPSAFFLHLSEPFQWAIKLVIRYHSQKALRFHWPLFLEFSQMLVPEMKKSNIWLTLIDVLRHERAT